MQRAARVDEASGAWRAANIGVAPATANSVDWRRRPARRRRRPQRVEVERPGGGQPGQRAGSRATSAQRTSVGRPRRRLLDDRERDRRSRADLAERDREADRAAVPTCPGSARPEAERERHHRDDASAARRQRPPRDSHVASERPRRGTASRRRRRSGAASGWSDVPSRRPGASHQPPTSSIARPGQRAAGRVSSGHGPGSRRRTGARVVVRRPPARSLGAIADHVSIGRSAPASVGRARRRRRATGVGTAGSTPVGSGGDCSGSSGSGSG